jgi:AcrR family transcriptional regulator
VNTRTPETRQDRKQRTREELLRAALRLLEGQSFSSLSLREVTREAGVVPTAFYRHFDTMEDLGLALIDESFRTLREMIRAARADPATFEHVISSSVEILVRHVHENRLHFRFIARELFASDLATDLVRFPYMRDWSAEDLHVMAGLLVNAMVSIVEELLDAPANSRGAEREVRRIAEKQLRMILLAAPAWRSGPGADA